jgi:arylsulfatase A-like enzyme
MNMIKTLSICCIILILAACGRMVEKPNIILIMADDLGYSNTTIYGTTDYYETPNIQKLADSGIRFTNAYAAHSVCSPTRGAIQTGLNPARTGIIAAHCHIPATYLRPFVKDKANESTPMLSVQGASRLDTAYYTMGEAFRDNGYRTAHFGKWHLGFDGYGPADHGFEIDVPNAPHMAWPGKGYLGPWDFFPEDAPYRGKPGEHLTNWLGDQVANQVAEWSDGDQPFFIQFWPFGVHSPYNAREDYIQYFTQKAGGDTTLNPIHPAMVKSLDEAVGQVVNAVEKAGIRDNTIIIFFSDNGAEVRDKPWKAKKLPVLSNKPLRGGKLQTFEGALRVPCVWSWPGHYGAGAVTDAMFSGTDFYPTFVELCGLDIKDKDVNFDGVSQLKVLKGGDQVRDEFLCHFPENFRPPDFIDFSTTLRQGDWKLIRFWWMDDARGHKYALYNLKEDPAETRNLFDSQPEKVEELIRYMDERLEYYGAVSPVPNPDYDPGTRAWKRLESLF